MKTTKWTAALGALAVGCTLVAAVPSAPPSATSVAESGAEGAGRVALAPVIFEANHGQGEAGVGFLARSGAMSLALSPIESRFEVDGPKGATEFHMTLVGADPGAAQVGQSPLETKVNYHSGSDPTRWHTDIPTYARVVSKSVYPGIDLAWYSKPDKLEPDKLEYDFVVAPGADPTRIRMSFADAERLRLDKGDLVVSAGGSELRHQAPVSYQVIDGKRQAVSGRFVVDDKTVGFDLGPYDSTRQLVIDPVVAYSTYLGGDAEDQISDVAVDGSGNAYVAGYTSSGAFPTKWRPKYGAAPPPRAGAAMAYQPGAEPGKGKAVLFGGRGANGNLLGDTWVFDGATWAELNITGALPSPRVFAAMASEPSGRVVLFGGEGATSRLGDTWVFDGSAWTKVGIDGATASPSPRSRAAMATSNVVASPAAPGVVLFGGRSANGSLLGDTWMWNGATWAVQATTTAPPDRAEAAVATDATGVVHVFGGIGEAGALNDMWTWSGAAWQPAPGATTNAPSARRQASLARDDAGALHLVGGRGGNTLLSDRWIYRAGQDSPWTRTKVPPAPGPRAGAATTHHAGAGMAVVVGGEGPTGALGDTWVLDAAAMSSAFVAKLNPTGTGLKYVTHFTITGGYSENRPSLDVEVDLTGTAYVLGADVKTPGFPTTPNAYQLTCKLDAAARCRGDAVISVLGPTGAIRYGTYLGGSGGEGATSMVLGPGGSVYVSGLSTSSDFPTTSGAYMPACTDWACGQSLFLAKLVPAGTGAKDLVYATYVGGSRSLLPYGMAVDADGVAFLTGEAGSNNMTTTPGAFQRSCGVNAAGSCSDAYVIKLAPSGAGLNDLRYASYLGGACCIDNTLPSNGGGGADAGKAIAVGPDGAVYVAGGTGSKDFPVTSGAFDTSFECFSDFVCIGFVAKLYPNGKGSEDLRYATYLGGGADDFRSLYVDDYGRAVVAGRTLSDSFPIRRAVQKRCGCASGSSNYDAVVAKVDPSVSGDGSGTVSAANQALVFSTFWGGSQHDVAYALSLDTSGNIYTVGFTESVGLFTTAGAFQSNSGGAYDGWAAKFTGIP